MDIFLISIILVCVQIAGMEPAEDKAKLFKSVEKLLENKGRLLKKWVQEENDGKYSYDLPEACITLEKFFRSENIGDVVNKYDPKIIHRAQLVAERQSDRAKLMDAIHCYDFPQVDKILERNPDVVNAYQNFGLCRGWSAPLHEFVEADDAVAVEYLLANAWRWKLNIDACGGYRSDSGKPTVCLAKSTYVIKQLLEARVDLGKKSYLYGKSVLACLLKSRNRFSLDLAECVVKNGPENLIYHMINIDCGGAFGRTLLMEFIKHDEQYDSISFLLHHKANLLQSNSEGETPLSLAIEQKKPAIFRLFKHANLFFIPCATDDIIGLLRNDAHELKLIFKQKDNAEKYRVRNLLAELCIVLNRHCTSRRTAMDGIMMLQKGWCFNNATYGDLQLLVGGAGVSYMKHMLYTVCDAARNCVVADWKQFKKMVKNNPFVLHYDKQVAFDIYLHLIKNSTDRSVWVWKYQNYEVFKTDATAVDGDGNSLLHHAVLLNKPWAVKLLACQPGFLLQRNNQGHTAFDIAVAAEDKACLSALLGFIFFDCNGGCFENFLLRKEIKELFESIQDVNALTIDGTPLLHRVVATSRMELCEIVLKKGAKVDAKDKDGKTALWYVETRNMLTVLLAHGAILSQEIVERHEPGDGLRIILEKVYQCQKEEGLIK